MQTSLGLGLRGRLAARPRAGVRGRGTLAYSAFHGAVEAPVEVRPRLVEAETTVAETTVLSHRGTALRGPLVHAGVHQVKGWLKKECEDRYVISEMLPMASTSGANGHGHHQGHSNGHSNGHSRHGHSNGHGHSNSVFNISDPVVAMRVEAAAQVYGGGPSSSRDPLASTSSWEDGTTTPASRITPAEPAETMLTTSSSSATTTEIGVYTPFTPDAEAAPQHSRFTAVFDGHGGSCAVQQAVRRMPIMLNEDGGLWRDIEASTPQQSILTTRADEAMSMRWRKLFGALDSEILHESVTSGNLDGTTVLVSLQSGRKLFIAHAGDSRAVLCRGNVAVRLTRDHTPNLTGERKRIEANGGIVQSIKGTWRIVLVAPNGFGAKLCAVSRGLGDADFKQNQLIISEPEASALLLQNEDQFTIHASDGLWSHVQDQEAVNAVLQVKAEFAKMQSHVVTQQHIAQAAAKALVRLAQDRGSMDDITIVVSMYEWDAVESA